MLIDWFTVGAQTLNFLILVWVMKRFLYKPILHAIDEREKRIVKELGDADTMKAEAQAERSLFQEKNEEFDRKRAALMSQATEQVAAQRQLLMEEARMEADALSGKWRDALGTDAQNLNQALGQKAQHEVFAIARKILTDLADVNLEERIGQMFTRRLRDMDGPAKARLAQAVGTASGPALVRSAFDLPAPMREAIGDALNELLSAEVPVRFETSPELVGGVELTTNGQKVAWSVADYLGALEKGVGELLKQGSEPEAKVEPKGAEVRQAKDKTESLEPAKVELP